MALQRWAMALVRKTTLPGRFLVLFSLALLPIGLVAVYQTAVVIREAQELERRDLLSRTAEAASIEYGLIQRAMGASHALGAIAVGADGDQPACASAMREFIRRNPQFIFAGFIEPSGVMSCTSNGADLNFAGAPSFERFRAAPRPTVGVNAQGAATGQSVMIVTTPVFDSDSTLLGAASVSIPHSLADVLLNNHGGQVELALLNGDGTVLSASTGFENADRFAHFQIIPNELDTSSAGVTLEAINRAGEPVTLALVEMVDLDLFVLGKWGALENRQLAPLMGTAAPAFPVLMWLASLFVAYWAVDRLVLRHLTVLRRSMTAFSPQSGESRLVALPHASVELREIADSYNLLMMRTLEDHARLENSVYEKEILLREVHHRVKNNLQLIASILNMQLRSVDAPKVRRILTRIQDRVMSLATIHKALYTDTQVDRVRVDTLLREIVGSLLSVSNAQGPQLQSSIQLAHIELDPDQAVPLCLLVTEAVTNAVKYAGAQAGQDPQLWVHLASLPDSEKLSIEIGNSCGPIKVIPDDGEEGTQLGARLITAFVSQLGGQIETEASDLRYVLRVEFTRYQSTKES